MNIKLPIFFSSTLLMLLCACGIGAQSTEDQKFTKLNADLSLAYSQAKYDDALTVAILIVDLIKKKYPKPDLNLARALKNRGFIENAKGDTKRAAETLEDAADIFKKQPDLGKADGASFAGLLEALATIKMAASFASGESYLQLALKWREKSNGSESPETAGTLARLANIKFWSRDYRAASEMYKRALLVSAKTTRDLTDDSLSIIQGGARCSYRKAKIEDDFAVVEAQYRQIIDALPITVKRAKTISGGVLNGKAIFLAKPSYPAEAKQNRASGSVAVQVLISEKGEILSACNVSGNPLLAESSEIAAMQSKYSPTLLAGQPVKVSGVITYNYVP